MSAPTTHFINFDVNAVDPSGYRNIDASGLKILDVSSSGAMDFGILNNSSGIVVTTPTKCAVWVVDTMGDATTEIFDMRFWLSSITDFVGIGIDYNVWFNQVMHTTWQQSINIDKDDGEFTPTELPAGQNLLSSSGLVNIASAGKEPDCSQNIYLSVSVDPDMPVGTYGGDGVGAFRYRVTYKYI